MYPHFMNISCTFVLGTIPPHSAPASPPSAKIIYEVLSLDSFTKPDAKMAAELLRTLASIARGISSIVAVSPLHMHDTAISFGRRSSFIFHLAFLLIFYFPCSSFLSLFSSSHLPFSSFALVSSAKHF